MIALVEKRSTSAPNTFELVHLGVSTETGRAPRVSLKLRVRGKIVSASGSGSGPVDAAYKTVDRLLKAKTKLLDYQIRSVTVGKDAQGEVTVKIAGPSARTIIGQGLSTDVIEASVRAYLEALNKLAHASALPKKGRQDHGI